MVRQNKSILQKSIYWCAIVLSASIFVTSCGFNHISETTEAEETQVTEVAEAETDAEGTEVNQTEDAETEMDETDADGTESAKTGLTISLPFSYENFRQIEFWFGSGAGFWATTMFIHPDGTFVGSFQDWEGSEYAPDYPNGTVFISEFKGQLSQPVQESEFCYSAEVIRFELVHEIGYEEIRDDTRYVYTEPFGMENAKTIQFFLPGFSCLEVPEEATYVRNGVGFFDSDGNRIDGELTEYLVYNVEGYHGFCTYIVRDSIQYTIDAYRLEEASLMDSLESGSLTRQERIAASERVYELEDLILNCVWAYLQKMLTDSEYKTLLEEQREWLAYRDEQIAFAGMDAANNTEARIAENLRGRELTEERANELLAYMESL